METLSQREIQVADLIHRGFIEKEIANELSISKDTVHTHSKNIKRKLRARNIADITRIFLTEIKSNSIEIIVMLILIYLIIRDPSNLESVKAELKSIIQLIK